jgi:hypothetical protein
MSRGATTRRKIVFRKKQKSRKKIKSSQQRKKRKKLEAKSCRKCRACKNICGSPHTAIFSIRIEVGEKSDLTCYRNAAQQWDLGRFPEHLPVDASSFNATKMGAELACAGRQSVNLLAAVAVV